MRVIKSKGKNLLKITDDINQFITRNNNRQAILDFGENYLKLQYVSNYNNILINKEFENNKIYTLSCEASQNYSVGFRGFKEDGSVFNETLSGWSKSQASSFMFHEKTYTKYTKSITFMLPNTIKKFIILFGVGSGTVEIKNIQMEVGMNKTNYESPNGKRYVIKNDDKSLKIGD